MLDELLGRAALKERIAELETEAERLRERYEAESERRAEAVSERQTAEQRVNRLEDRIAELEDRVERASDGNRELALRGRETLRGDRATAVLDRLASVEAGPEGALTAMVADGLPGAVREAFGDRAPLVDRLAPCVAVTDDAGLVSAALSPPVAPEPFTRWDASFALDREWFLPTGRYALALVRSDLFAMGEYEGRERRSIQGFDSEVASTHSKGGFSQRRFERRREEQISSHLERCREAISDRETERLYVVGESSLLHEFDGADVTAPAGATGDPEAALDAAFEEFWAIELYLV